MRHVDLLSAFIPSRNSWPRDEEDTTSSAHALYGMIMQEDEPRVVRSDEPQGEAILQARYA